MKGLNIANIILNYPIGSMSVFTGISVIIYLRYGFLNILQPRSYIPGELRVFDIMPPGSSWGGDFRGGGESPSSSSGAIYTIRIIIGIHLLKYVYSLKTLAIMTFTNHSK